MPWPGATRSLPGALPARALLEPRDELVSSVATIDRPGPEVGQQGEDRLALLVAHQDDDPGRVRPRAVRAASAAAAPLSSAWSAAVSDS